MNPPSEPVRSPQPRERRTADLPIVRTTHTVEQALERLGRASKRGKLPGFHRSEPGCPHAAWFEIFGKYFDHRLTVRAEPEASGLALSFENRPVMWRVAAFWAIVVLSVWPGVLLMHSLLASYFWGYPRSIWITCAWYLPLAVVPIPWVWRTAWRQSTAIADAEARKTIGLVASHLGESTEDAGGS